MLNALTTNWWAWLIRGILAIIFGVIAFTQPTTTALALVYVFGIYAIAEGILNIWAALSGKADSRFWYIIWGLISIIAGIIAFSQPVLTGFTLVIVIGAWAIVTGIFEIIAGIKLRDEIEGEFWLILGGILSVIFGILIWRNVAVGALTIVWLIGIYAILFGITLIALAFKVKGIQDNVASLKR